jgi:hypothetical protein
MALWSDPLDELITDLQRTLPVQPTFYNPRHPWKDLVELQRMVQESMRSGRRRPLRPDPSADPEAAEDRDGSKANP